MITWKDRIEQVKATFAIKNNKQLEEQLGLGNGYVNDLIGGSKNKNPKRIIEALVERYKISPVWFFDESVGMFGDKQENAVKQESDLILAIRKTENNNEDRFSEIENRLTAIETLLKESQHERMQAVSSNKDDPLHTAENEPAYGDEEGAEEEYEEIPYVHDIAAGPPIPQSNGRYSSGTAPPYEERKALLRRKHPGQLDDGSRHPRRRHGTHPLRGRTQRQRDTSSPIRRKINTETA